MRGRFARGRWRGLVGRAALALWLPAVALGAEPAPTAASPAVERPAAQDAAAAALPILEKALADPDRSVREAAAGRLAKIGGNEARRILAEALDHKDDRVRQSAAGALAVLRDPELVRRALDSPHPEVRQRAVRAAGTLNARGWPFEENNGEDRPAPLQTSEVLDLLEKAMGDASSGVRAAAVAALERAAGETAWRSSPAGGEPSKNAARILAILSKALGDPGSKVRLQAIRMLEKNRSDATTPLLERALEDASHDVQVMAASALMDGKHAEALLAHPSSHVRVGAIRSIDRLGAEAAMPRLRAALADPDGLVRGNAAYLLGTLARRAGGAAEAFPLIEKVAADPDLLARGMALLGLGELGEERGVPLLEAALNDPSEPIRVHAVSALGCLMSVVPFDMGGGESRLTRMGRGVGPEREKRVREMLLARWAVDRSPYVRKGLREMLEAMFPEDAEIRRALAAPPPPPPAPTRPPAPTPPPSAPPEVF